ncbi:MAG: hypothetical protein LC791_16735, partial [Acidobacteria bacterium]|nr:hypothetical protein [Acidobacteriota bacterium]
MAQSPDRDVDAEDSAFLWPPSVHDPAESRAYKTPATSAAGRAIDHPIVSAEPDTAPRVVATSVDLDPDTISFEWPLLRDEPDRAEAEDEPSVDLVRTAPPLVPGEDAVAVPSKPPWRRAAPADWPEDEWTEDEGWPLDEELLGPSAIAINRVPAAESRMRKPLLAAALLALLAGASVWAVVTRYGVPGFGQAAIRARALPTEVTELAPVVTDDTPRPRIDRVSREASLVAEQGAVPATATPLSVPPAATRAAVTPVAPRAPAPPPTASRAPSPL